MSKKPTVLMILDGFGLNDKKDANAVYEAKTPVIDNLMATYPFVKGNASGLSVGLPEGQMGNSEVGHMNMGAGRIVYQDLTRITKEIQDGTFFENPALLKAIENVKANNSALHLYGLLSDGGVHSHNTHLYGLLELAKRHGLEKVYVHCFLDGRDTPPASGADYIKELYEKMQELGVGQIASVMGRYYAMDRDNRWDRVEKAYRAIAFGEGIQAECPYDAVKASYEQEVYDDNGKIKYRKTDKIRVNSVAQYVQFCRAVIELYTDLEIDKDDKGFIKEYDALKSSGLLDILMVGSDKADPLIPMSELSEFKTILTMKQSDTQFNETTTQAFISKQIERISDLANATLTPLMDVVSKKLDEIPKEDLDKVI